MGARRVLFNRENVLVALATGIFVAALYFTSPSIISAVDYVLFHKPNFDFLHDSLASRQIPGGIRTWGWGVHSSPTCKTLYSILPATSPYSAESLACFFSSGHIPFWRSLACVV